MNMVGVGLGADPEGCLPGGGLKVGVADGDVRRDRGPEARAF